MNSTEPFKWRHFQTEIILLNVRWYLKYPLSYRNLEDMMLEGSVAKRRDKSKKVKQELKIF